MRTRGDKVRLKLAEPLGAVGDMLGLRRKDPVFIVGTGRCGSSLLTRILDSHPSIVGFPNEANHLWHPRLFPYSRRTVESASIEVDPKAFTETSVANWPVGHVDKIRRTFRGFHIGAGINRVLFVKSAMISFLLPEIATHFPDARFVHIYRYGPSVVRSAVRKNAPKEPSDANADEKRYERWAGYWNDCIMEIDRARNELGLDRRRAYFECGYEFLCSEPRKVLRDLSSFLGVEEKGFAFDLSKIENKNYKATKDEAEPWLKRMTTDEARYPAMRLKGYLS